VQFAQISLPNTSPSAAAVAADKLKYSESSHNCYLNPIQFDDFYFISSPRHRPAFESVEREHENHEQNERFDRF
jgi:hypothetical protein